MKLRAIHLFVLLLLALVLCSSLGSYMRENMTSGRDKVPEKFHKYKKHHGYKKHPGLHPKAHIEPVDPLQAPQASISSNSYGTKGYDTPNNTQASSITQMQSGQHVLATPQNTTQGIPPSNIPPGQEDLYILKSEVVPPVCPACPIMNACPRQEPPPPCPPCARCPEPAFECKKVPNYRTNDDRYLPRPVLNDFSQFGM